MSSAREGHGRHVQGLANVNADGCRSDARIDFEVLADDRAGDLGVVF